jgi:hypothetical protein
MFLKDAMLFNPSLIAQDRFWHGPLLDHYQVEIGKVCFYFRLDVNVLCLKKIDGPGSWQFFVYRCKFNHDAITDKGEPIWVDKVCKYNWIRNPKNQKKCMDFITYETPESVNREELQQLLQSQSDSTLTMGLVGSIAEDEVESVYLVNLTSGLQADPLNKEIQDRVKQVMNAEEVSPPKRRRDAEDVSPSTKRRRDAEKTSVIGSSRKLRSEL